MRKGDMTIETLVKLIIAILIGVGVILLIAYFAPKLGESSKSFFDSMRF